MLYALSNTVRARSTVSLILSSSGFSDTVSARELSGAVSGS